MDPQIKRGLLDACVLALLAKGESYGYKITQDSLRLMEVSETTLYPVLRRMESQGYLGTRQQEHNGRLRKYYHLTGQGAQRLAAFQEEWREVKTVIDYIMGEGEAL